jgi:hypothetical protein
MVKQVSKKEGLEITIKKFESSKRTENDYLELFLVFMKAIRPDNGLTWSQVEEVVKNALYIKEDNTI